MWTEATHLERLEEQQLVEYHDYLVKSQNADRSRQDATRQEA
jgi:hypothetical protein